MTDKQSDAKASESRGGKGAVYLQHDECSSNTQNMALKQRQHGSCHKRVSGHAKSRLKRVGIKPAVLPLKRREV